MVASLDEMVNSYLNGENYTGMNLIIPNFCTQMRMFGYRKGVELYPDQDDIYSSRAKFIKQLWEENKLDIYQERLFDLLVCTGQFLLYLRPNDKSYNINFYEKDQFRDYYDANGNLTEVVIIYSYKLKNSIYGGTNNLNSPYSIRWVKIVVTADKIKQGEYNTQPSFDGDIANGLVSNEIVVTNSLNFIPCVIVKNRPTAIGQNGISDFALLRNQIEAFEALTEAINRNIVFFGNPTLVTTRSSREVTEAMGDEQIQQFRHTMASNGGWVSSKMNSTSKSVPRGLDTSRIDENTRIKKVIGNVQNDERFGYIAPSPISPDHYRQLLDTREAIFFALGTIDERGISANATAYEMKSIYGKVTTTASKKAEAIYTHGLCLLFQMAITAEEDLFRASLANALGMQDMNELTDDYIQQLIEENKIPPNVFGLPPLGSRKVKWRYTGSVFEKSSRDKMDDSIVIRNLQELGVNSVDALKMVGLFEDKTEKEIEGILSKGFAFRYIQSIAMASRQFLDLYQYMLSLPDPENPNLPMAFRFPIVPFVESSFNTIFNELSYKKQFEPVAEGDIPQYKLGVNNYDNYLSTINSPTSTTSTTGTSIPSAYGTTGFTGSFNAFGSNPRTDYAVGIPTPESVVSTTHDAGLSPNSTWSEYTTGQPTPYGIPLSDLPYVLSNPEQWVSIYPQLSELIQQQSKTSKS